MPRKQPIDVSPKITAFPALTAGRVRRLCRFVQMLGAGPQSRPALLKKLNLDTRGFYRDFQQMRKFGIPIQMRDRCYQLLETVEEALGRLPFPDPGLSVQEVLLLARGRTPAHRKLRRHIELLLGRRVSG